MTKYEMRYLEPTEKELLYDENISLQSIESTVLLCGTLRAEKSNIKPIKKYSENRDKKSQTK